MTDASQSDAFEPCRLMESFDEPKVEERETEVSSDRAAFADANSPAERLRRLEAFSAA